MKAILFKLQKYKLDERAVVVLFFVPIFFFAYLK